MEPTRTQNRSITRSRQKRASDLHFKVGLPPMLRVDGALSPVMGFNPSWTSSRSRAAGVCDPRPGLRSKSLKDKEFDFSFAFGTLGRFRVNAFTSEAISLPHFA